MLKTMTVTNFLGESVVINLRDNEPEHGLIIKEIDGLGPPHAVINMSDYATDDGSKWNSSRAEKRTIIMTFLLTMVPDIETARENTYKYFPLKKEVHLLFETDERTCEITGRVESNQPTIFVQDATETITIVCEEPWLYRVSDLEPQVTNFSVTEPAFEFPFSNESLDFPLIEFGRYVIHKERVLVYEGDTSVGMTMVIQCITPGVGDITVYNQTVDATMVIHTGKIQSVTGSVFNTGDQIIISTVDRTRSAKLLRNGIYTNILNIIERTSDWFELEKGDNVFLFSTSTGNDDYITFSIENRTVYEGI